MFKKCSSMLNFYPRRFISLKKAANFDWSKHEKKLMGPFEHVQKVPCKYHALVADCFNYWLQVPDQKMDAIQEAMQTLASWTIMFDDIQDNSPYRYGVSAAHEVFGVGLTINAANNALLLGQKQVAELGHPLAPEMLANTLKHYFYGQGIDIYWRDNYIFPDEDAHIEMTRQKSGSWLELPIALMQLFSGNETDYSRLANAIGAYHHVLDDYVNLFQPKELPRLARTIQETHLVCSDITECKITLPVIHASRFPDVASEVAYIYQKRTTDPKLHSRAISLLKKHGSDEYTRDALNTMEGEIRAEVDRLGGNPLLTSCMDELSFYE